MSVYRDTLENYLSKESVVGDLVFDMGGASNPAKNRVREWQVKRVDYFDNGAEETIEEWLRFDLNEDEVRQEDKYKYDVGFCLEVMEYIYDPVHALWQLSELMRDGGLLYITFPTLYPMHNPVDIDYLRYTRRGAIKLLASARFAPDEIIPRVIKNTGLYEEYIKAEQYKVRGAATTGTLFDAGYIIKAVKL